MVIKGDAVIKLRHKVKAARKRFLDIKSKENGRAAEAFRGEFIVEFKGIEYKDSSIHPRIFRDFEEDIRSWR